MKKVCWTVFLFLANLISCSQGGQKLEEQLLQAIRIGNVGQVEDLIKRGANLCVKDEEGWQFIHYAASYGQVGVLQLLIDKYDVNLNAKNEDGIQPLHTAVAYQNFDCVQQLLFRGANPHCVGRDNETAIAVAWMTNDSILIQLLTRFTQFKPFSLKRFIAQEPDLQKYQNPELSPAGSLEQIMDQWEQETRSFENDLADYWRERVGWTIHDDEKFKDLVCKTKRSNISVIGSLFKSSYYFLSLLREVQENLVAQNKQDPRLDEVVTSEVNVVRRAAVENLLREKVNRKLIAATIPATLSKLY